MSEILFLALIAHEEEERRRREEEEEEEREREEAERRRVIKHRKTSPVVCNNEDWQIYSRYHKRSNYLERWWT